MATLAPLPQARRIDALVAWRGLALLGVLRVNHLAGLRVSLFAHHFAPGAADATRSALERVAPRYEATLASIREVGLVEAFAIHPQHGAGGTYLLLDGYISSNPALRAPERVAVFREAREADHT